MRAVNSNTQSRFFNRNYKTKTKPTHEPASVPNTIGPCPRFLPNKKRPHEARCHWQAVHAGEEIVGFATQSRLIGPVPIRPYSFNWTRPYSSLFWCLRPQAVCRPLKPHSLLLLDALLESHRYHKRSCDGEFPSGTASAFLM